MRQIDQEQDARARAGANGPGGVVGRIAGQALQGPPTPYQRAYMRREREQNPSGRGGPTNALGRFNRSMDWTEQMVRNMGVADDLSAGATWLGQSAENLVRRARGQPIEIPANEAARAAADYETGEQRRFARERPEQNAIANVAMIPAMGGRPVNARVGAIEAGLGAGAINFPFALGRREGSFEERLPGAAAESAIVAPFAATLQGGANWLMRRPPNSGRIVQNMDRLNIPPTVAAASQNPITRSLTRVASENMLVGPHVRRKLTDSLEGTRDAASNLARSFATPRPPETTGRMVQSAVERYARNADLPNPQGAADPRRVSTREWSLASKARAVFDYVLRPIARQPAAPTSTRAELAAIMSRADDPAVQAFRQDPVLRQFAETLDQTRTPTLRDLRELRRSIREAQNRPALDGQSVDNASLQRLEFALSEDMYRAAGNLGDDLRRADDFYRVTRERVTSALQAIGGADATPNEAFQAIIAAANSRTANTQALVNLKRILRDDEWRSVAAGVIDQMGTPRPAASGIPTDIGFSVHEFARAYRAMSLQGRRLLFGSAGGARTRDLLRDLDDLAEIALRQKAIENMGTPSGRDVQNVLMGAGALANLPATAAGVLFLGVTGELLTSGPFVRWLTSAARGKGTGGVRGMMSALAALAARNPAVAPYYEKLLELMTAKPEPAEAPA